MSALRFTDENFKKEVLESELPVMVDFTAAWCGPCRMMAPIIDEMAVEFASSLRIGKLDVDSSPRTATQYQVMSIPTLIFFKKGKVMEQLVGAVNKAELKKRIATYIG